jgi:DNA-binding protein HU-beta
MNKTQLIESIAQNATLTKAEATRALNAMTDAITLALAGGDNVQLTGFGRFLVRDYMARTGRNPQTGEAMQKAASKVDAFKASRILTEEVNK